MDGCLSICNISQAIGDFKPVFLAYLPNITELDITSCETINPDDFTDYVQSCEKLQSLYMSGCSQFERYHFLEFLPNLSNLKYVDITETATLDLSSVYELLNAMICLKLFYFDPFKIMEQRFKWRDMVKEFIPRVEFALSDMSHFPALNQNSRMLKGQCEE